MIEGSTDKKATKVDSLKIYNLETHQNLRICRSREAKNSERCVGFAEMAHQEQNHSILQPDFEDLGHLNGSKTFLRQKQNTSFRNYVLRCIQRIGHREPYKQQLKKIVAN